MINNIQQLKYALEVEKTGSISRAAENLYMSQPRLSKAIRELEDSLGIAIFNRTSTGVVPTKKGNEFLGYARSILTQVDEMESLYRPTGGEKQIFDISVPRASYISYAFTEFVKEMDLNKDIDINYRETNSIQAIKNVADTINNLAIIRFQTQYEKYFLDALAERELEFRPIWEFEYRVLMSAKHPLAAAAIEDYSMLHTYTEIIHGDISIPALPISEVKQIAKTDERKKKIALYERGSQFELLSRIPTTYMWVSPMPKDVLACFSLVQKACAMAKNKYKDILIFRKGYRFSDEEEIFFRKLHESVEMVSQD